MSATTDADWVYTQANGAAFYHHIPTRRSTWTEPQHIQEAWIEAFDVQHHRLYYFNAITKETRWTCPPGITPRLYEPDTDWRIVTDGGSQRHYFYNVLTEERTWVLPKCLENVRTLRPLSFALPRGWKWAVDEATDRDYYYNRETSEVSWIHPLRQEQERTAECSLAQPNSGTMAAVEELDEDVENDSKGSDQLRDALYALGLGQRCAAEASETGETDGSSADLHHPLGDTYDSNLSLEGELESNSDHETLDWVEDFPRTIDLPRPPMFVPCLPVYPSVLQHAANFPALSHPQKRFRLPAPPPIGRHRFAVSDAVDAAMVQAVAPPMEVEWSGFMRKQGGGTSFMGRRTWRKRWCELQDSVLLYYKSPPLAEPDGSHSERPRGGILVYGSTVRVLAQPSRDTFEVRSPGPHARTIVFHALSSVDMQTCLGALIRSGATLEAHGLDVHYMHALVPGSADDNAVNPAHGVGR